MLVTSDAGPCRGAFVRVGAAQDVKVKLPDGRDAEDRALNGTTDALGRIAFPSVGAGESPVTAHLRGYETASSSVSVEPGRETAIELKLVKKAGLKERVERARVSCRMSGANLRDLAGYLSTVTKVNVVVMPGVDQRANGVTIDLRDQPLATVLRDACAQIGGCEFELNEEMDAVLIRVKKQ